MPAPVTPASPLLTPITSASNSPSSPLPTRTTFTDVFSTSRTPSPSAPDIYPTTSSLFTPTLDIRLPSTQTSHPSDIPRLRTTHVTAGYRDGISSSKAAAIQLGFDEGYPLGATLGIRVGYILGVLEGIVSTLRQGSQSQADEKSGAEAGGVENTDGQNGAEGSGKGLKMMEKMLTDARNELCIEKMFGKAVWGKDGVWKYKVEGEGEQGFNAVAEAHPMIKNWMIRVDEEKKRWCPIRILEGRVGENV